MNKQVWKKLIERGTRFAFASVAHMELSSLSIRRFKGEVFDAFAVEISSSPVPSGKRNLRLPRWMKIV